MSKRPPQKPDWTLTMPYRSSSHSRYVAPRSSGFASPTTLALIGIVLVCLMAGISKAQLDTRLNMISTQFNFTEAVLAARTQLTDHALNPTAPTPLSTGAWIALFNQQVPFAPGGGPAFIVNKQGNGKTGAVGVSATHFGSEVHLTRPAYAILNKHTVIVRGSPALSANP